MILLNKFLRRVKNNELLNTSFYSGIGTAIGFISGFVVNKVIAIYVGPSGVAIISQFQNFIGISTAIATGGIQQGVTKYAAEVRHDEVNKAVILSTSLRITVFFALLVGILTSFNSRYLSIHLFDSDLYQYVFVVFGATVVLFGLNQLLMSILNGTGEIKKLVQVKISSNVFGLIVTSSSVYIYGLSGALVAIALSQSVIFFVSLVFVVKSDWFKLELFKDKIDRVYSTKLFKYSLMAMSSMILPPLVQIEIRNHIIDTLTIEEAGYWDGLGKISAAYLGIITTTLSIYYLPKLSVLKERLDIRNELLNGYKTITPVLLLAISLIYIYRDFIILVLYSSEFNGMSYLFAPQLLGDLFKIMSWLLAYMMLAKAQTTMFITTQIVFSTLTYFLSIHLINIIGIDGVVWAHAIKYFIYLLVMSIIFRSYLIK